ncbi:MAG: hypothetical protein ACOX7I_01965 [Oscillospiraceae bacterium]|jgi:hypothetical protein
MATVIVAYVLVALLELIPIIKSRSWRHIVIFGVLFTISFALAILLKLKVRVPSIMLFLGDLLRSCHLTY